MDSNSRSRPLRRQLEELERRDTPAFVGLQPFTAGITIPTVIASADFNGDGFADVAIGNELNTTNVPSVAIEVGKGDGTFTARPELTSPLLGTPKAIAAADLTGDGIIDLVVGSFTNSSSNGSLLLFRGNGDGTFKAATPIVPMSTIAIGVADFNNDGIPDLAVEHPDSINSTLSVQALLGIGNGAFTIGPPQFVGADGPRLAVADFDKDGHQDIIAIDAVDRLYVTLFGNGAGDFTNPPPGFVPLNVAPTDIASGDFTGDGLPDLVFSSISGVVLIPNLGGRQFDPNATAIYPNSTMIAPRIVAADVNGDGVPDVIGSNDVEVRVFLKTATGFREDTPSSPFAIAGVNTFTDVAAGDVNGDRNTDFILARRSEIAAIPSDGRVFLNLARVPTITSISAVPSPGTEGQPVTMAATIAFIGNPFPPGVLPSGAVAFELDGAFLGNANVAGGTATLTTILTAGTHILRATYLGDTRFLPSQSAPLDVPINLAPGHTFQYEVTGLPTLPGLGADRVAAGSITPDGISDIVLGSGPGRTAEVSVIDGSSRVEIASVQPFGPDFTGGLMVAVGDIDGNGVGDVAVAADMGGGPRVSIYLNGVSELTNNFFALDDAFRGGLRIALGDVDGDGRADLVVAGGPGAGPRIATYDARTLTNFHTPERLFNDFFALDPATRLGCFVAVGDLNGDGRADIAVSSDAGGGPIVSIFDGQSFFTQPELLANFLAGNPDARGGLRIAIRDISVDEGLELIVGDGPGAGSTVRVYSSFDVLLHPDPDPLIATELMPGYLGGVFVA